MKSCHAMIIVIITIACIVVAGFRMWPYPYCSCRCRKPMVYIYIYVSYERITQNLRCVFRTGMWMQRMNAKCEQMTKQKRDGQCRAFMFRFNVCSMRTITDNFYRVCSHKETRFEFIFLLVLIIQFPV